MDNELKASTRMKFLQRRKMQFKNSYRRLSAKISYKTETKEKYVKEKTKEAPYLCNYRVNL